jgi:hypothetical protein
MFQGIRARCRPIPYGADVGPSTVRMNQQSERVGLGGGGGAPMDQQQGAWSGKLATVPGVLSG